MQHPYLKMNQNSRIFKRQNCCVSFYWRVLWVVTVAPDHEDGRPAGCSRGWAVGWWSVSVTFCWGSTLIDFYLFPPFIPCFWSGTIPTLGLFLNNILLYFFVSEHNKNVPPNHLYPVCVNLLFAIDKNHFCWFFSHQGHLYCHWMLLMCIGPLIKYN